MHRTDALLTLLDGAAVIWLRGREHHGHHYWHDVVRLVQLDPDDYDQIMEHEPHLGWTGRVVKDTDGKLINIGPRVIVDGHVMSMKNFVLNLPRATRGVRHVDGDIWNVRKHNLAYKAHARRAV